MNRRILSGGRAGDARLAGSRQIAANAGLQLVMRVLQIAAGLLTLPLLARTLGPDAFGTWTAALGYVGLFAAFTEFGLTSAATMKMAGDPEREGEWLSALSSLRTLFGVVLTAICLAGIPLLLSDAEDMHAVALVLTVTIPAAGAASVMAVFQSRLRAIVPLVISMLQTVLWLGAVVAIAATDAGVVQIAVIYASLLVLMAFIQVQAARRLASFAMRGARERWRELLSIALPIGVSSVLITVYFRLDSVLVFELAGEREAGLYGAAYRFLDPLVFLPAAVMAAFLPVFAAHVDADRERLRRLVQRCGEIMVVLGVGGVAVGLTLSDQIVDLLFGDAFAEAAGILPVLMLAFAAICFGNLGGYLAPIVGMRWQIAQIALVGAVINIGLNVAFVPAHGALAAAWATVATEVVTMGIMLALALRRLGLRPAWRRPACAVLAGVAMTGAIVAAEPAGLVPALLAGGVVYAGALLALRVVVPAELRALRGG